MRKSFTPQEALALQRCAQEKYDANAELYYHPEKIKPPLTQEIILHRIEFWKNIITKIALQRKIND